MKQILTILFLYFLLLTNISKAKTIEIAKGMVFEVPYKYKSMEIKYRQIEKLISQFPNLKTVIKSKEYEEYLKILGVGKNSKLIVIVENQEALKLFEKISTSKGIEDLITQYSNLQTGPVTKHLEKTLTPEIRKKLDKMSEKELLKWFEQFYEEPANRKVLDKITTNSIIQILNEYKLNKYVIVFIMNKKIDREIYKQIQTVGTSKCIYTFYFNCRENGEVKDYLVNEIKNYISENDDALVKINNAEFGRNSKNSLFFYTQINSKYKDLDFNSEGELLLFTRNKKLAMAVSTCFKNCNNFSDIIYKNLYTLFSK